MWTRCEYVVPLTGLLLNTLWDKPKHWQLIAVTDSEFVNLRFFATLFTNLLELNSSFNQIKIRSLQLTMQLKLIVRQSETLVDKDHEDTNFWNPLSTLYRFQTFLICCNVCVFIFLFLCNDYYMYLFRQVFIFLCGRGVLLWWMVDLLPILLLWNN